MRQAFAQVLVADEPVDLVREVAGVARPEEQAVLLAVEGLAHRAEVRRDHRDSRELALADGQAERLPPERRHDEHVDLGQDPRQLGRQVGAVEVDVAKADRARLQPLEVVGVVVEHGALAVDVELEPRLREQTERVDEDVGPLDRDHGSDEPDLPHRARLPLDPPEWGGIEAVRERDDAIRVDREIQHPLAMEPRRRDQDVREPEDVGEVAIELGERLRREPAARV